MVADIFFLATLEEAITIRKINSKGNVYVLNGLENNNLDIFKKYKIIPILISLEELKQFIKSKFYKTKFQIGIHIDTGLNRLGIKIQDLSIKDTKKLELTLLMSHLSSADEYNNHYNDLQNKKFQSIFNYFKSIKFKSLANSAGILNKKYHYDLIRPGITLYGGYDNFKLKKLMSINSVIILKAKVLQIKTLKKNTFVGYNQTYKTKKEITIAILGIGYGDGFPRILSNKGNVFYKNKSFNIIGRVSMDTITVDITNNDKDIEEGNYLEIINYQYGIDAIAKESHTICDEILTSISNRVKRKYI